ncbi:pentapeptide repeat-containing protein [Streptomyces sp. ISL-11]|uniref:pentapeptide repeat-containing protein n=1 Tax=Streptomyces sp. ISL-11 TaxID=2819174 RepID=UPI001BEC3E67|nr:pentapeptide repeat-containing protein [Streptomyces sp. ISL-11]MBT2382289.1 pentapeptide repeat-containing protein [Streptomyces sp. ISL-11]
METRGGTQGGKKTARKASPTARVPEVRLPPLRPFGGAGLEPEGDYDGLDFTECDFAGQAARGARFLDCGLFRCALDEARLSRARFVDCVLDGVRGVGTDLAEAGLRDVEVRDARLGGTQLHGAVLERVLVRGGKIDYLNLRKAKLKDVTFEGCVLSEADFGGASLERVVFRDCVLRRADFTAVRMKDVDLRAVGELDIARGVEGLSGAVISPSQLLDLAPAFAAQIGVRVEEPAG